MKPILQVQVKTRGRITLPMEYRQANDIQDGDVVILTQIGNGCFVMRSHASEVNRLADQLAKQWRKDGITFKDLYEKLYKIRK
ncbi:MAG: AbrB/MazE/SpoVT family DNA-binding domain-containing protein [Chloroflexi bacterium]|nr:AbrB/MazE/SpoVT family DNA-binding domain-containing protein [Chloroflexota bacterium]